MSLVHLKLYKEIEKHNTYKIAIDPNRLIVHSNESLTNELSKINEQLKTAEVKKEADKNDSINEELFPQEIIPQEITQQEIIDENDISTDNMVNDVDDHINEVITSHSVRFKVNDKVKNQFDDVGTIIDINNEKQYLLVKWEDDSKERIIISNNDLELIENYITNETLIDEDSFNEDFSNEDIVDDIINDITENSSNETILNENVTNNTSNEISTNENQNSNDDSVDIEHPNLDNLLQQQKVKKAVKRQNKELSIQSAKELVDLALQKGMIDEDEYDLELMKVEAFDEDSFNQYKSSVLDTKLPGEVTSKEDDMQGMSPEEIKARNIIRSHRQVTASYNDYSDGESRSLSELNNNIPIENMTKPPSFEDSLLSIMNNLSQEQSPNNDLVNDNSINDNLSDDLDTLDNYVDIDALDVNDSVNDNVSMNDDARLDQLIRQLQRNDNSKTATNKQSSIMTFNQKPKVQTTMKKVANNNKNFLSSPFSGLTKPLIMAANENANPIDHAFSQLFSNDLWTVPGQRR